MNQFWGVDADPTAQGRIKGARPVAVLDIGSNSVRLVVYERHARALTALYNEKSSCALGRGVAATGRLAYENIDRALTAIQRFALVSKLMRVGRVHILATSAVRDAANAAAFVEAVEKIMGAPVRVLSGEEEAHFAALGVIAGMPDFDGVVGDLGGGSLELSSMLNGTESVGETHQLGVIRLQDDSDNTPAKAPDIVRERLATSELCTGQEGRTFCAIGGTWRSLAKILQAEEDYPLRMIQHYEVRSETVLKLCDDIVSALAEGKPMPGSDAVSSSRRDLVPYGASVLGEVLRAGGFDKVVFSALGVREGYLYGLLDPREQAVDPLMQAAEEMSLLRSRSPAHANDLMAFTDDIFAALAIEETPAERRLRHVACLLADIGWRGHPDYRGTQSVDMVAYSALTGIDHPGRAFLSQVLALRYMGLKSKHVAQPLMALAGEDGSARARLIAAAFRVGYPMSAAMPGVLPRARFTLLDKTLTLHLPADLAFLDGEHLRGRLDQLGNVASGVKSTSIAVLAAEPAA
ncbi:Ppx/GppA family phosphatase [Arsenicitalea aurantiaca]|uniref:Ppx/GppA family phosphatase n=1 Tax=Arsenicitalea aurantiaca TaxID=1783274 RepID=A0A433XFC8_9HYPH|nr:Ppx/GppA phosphatase family protein [Arsenicitalea aurantiaca]RUT32817.1 Ppx/GppA family phosphatase [Arsenicitalea aurantiaca]